jgi:hypothetical protein
MQYAAKDMFQLQTEWVDAKVKTAVNDNLSIVISKIDALKDEVHDLRHEMNQRFSHVESRLTAVETKLGMRNEIQSEIRNRMVEYGFKAGWLILATIATTVLLYFHIHS